MGTSHPERLAQLADEQGGPVAREQLRALGVSRKVVARMVRTSLLREVHRGVYVFGHRALTAHGRLMAAVLAGGPGAVASHRSAAWLHGLLASDRAKQDVTVMRDRRSDVIDFHTCRLTPEDITVVDGIPCTTVARTLLDLAEVVPPRLVERAIEQAEVRRVFDLGALEAAMARGRGRRGLKPLRAVLAIVRPGTTLTRSELEERMLALVRAGGLPQPDVNARVAGFEVDFLWRAHRLVVEVDGAATHLTRRAFEHDRRKDAELTLAGYRVVRFTWRGLDDAADTLRRLLA